jgi:hypothetical protein
VTSQQQVRALNQEVLGKLANLSTDPVLAQITAAVTLIQLQVSPLISIHIPFGGDNHSDAGLVNEATQTVSGVGYIVSMLQALQNAQDAHGVSLQDQVMFMTLNVLVKNSFGDDYGATSIDSTTGASNGDVAATDTLAAFGMTMLKAVGGDPTIITSQTGKPIAAALAWAYEYARQKSVDGSKTYVGYVGGTWATVTIVLVRPAVWRVAFV